LPRRREVAADTTAAAPPVRRAVRERFVAPVVAFVVAVTVLLIAAVLTYGNILRFVEQARWVEHTHGVIERAGKIRLLTQEAQNSVRGYAITGQEKMLEPYVQALGVLYPEIQALRAMVRDNPDHGRQVDRVQEKVLDLVGILKAIVDAVEQGDRVAAQELVLSGQGELAVDAIYAEVDALTAAEKVLLDRRRTDAEREGVRAGVTMAIAGALTLVLLTIAVLVLRREALRRHEAEVRVRELNRGLEQRAAQLENVNRELEAFGYSVSHDLRAPLRAIDGFGLMLDEDYADRLDDEGRRLLGVVRENAQRMGRLVDDLLDFSRIGRKVLTIRRTDMNALVRDVLDDLTDGDGAPAFQCTIGDLPEADCDADLLRQVWFNLLSNAVKYSGKRGQPQIEVSGVRTVDEVRYAVRDNGAGFDMRYYDKLFGVFQRLHRAEEFPGTGVGLAIIQRIVVRHGGRVWGEGKVDAGATFHFTLPDTGDRNV
ncbi:MAG: CHASE3 domain-containing protein, partial [Burkholderiales bacterium]|nr:CHASE3 domain-containing protein [Burkholderiales bacterium]